MSFQSFFWYINPDVAGISHHPTWHTCLRVVSLTAGTPHSFSRRSLRRRWRHSTRISWSCGLNNIKLSVCKCKERVIQFWKVLQFQIKVYALKNKYLIVSQAIQKSPTSINLNYCSSKSNLWIFQIVSNFLVDIFLVVFKV